MKKSTLLWCMVFALPALILPLGCFRLGGSGTAKSSVTSATGDTNGPSYTEARKQFESKLTKRGKAPQPSGSLEIPADVAEVTYESEGKKLKAWVDQSAKNAARKGPAVLFLHGGFAFGEDDWDQTAPLRDAGFHVLVPMLRGENGQPGVFSLHYGEVDDCLRAADVLAELPGVDRNALFVSGHSVGGTLAMFVALSDSRFRGAAPISGAPDCRTHLRGQLSLAPFDTSSDDEFRIRSPQRFARHFKCPVRLYYGDDEAAFFDPDSRKTESIAREAGLDVKAVKLRGNHMSVVEPALAAAITFFREQISKQK